MTIQTALLLASLEARTTSHTSTAQTLARGTRGVGQLVWTNNGGTLPTLDAKIQHSADGTVWKDLLTFTQATTGDGSEHVHVTEATLGGTVILPLLRSVSTIAGTNPDYDVEVKFFAA